MRKLADALEVSTGTVYHYFESKEDLFEQVVRAVIEENAEAAHAAFALGPDQVLHLRVRDILAYLIHQEEEQMRRFIVLIDYWRLNPEGRAALQPTLDGAHRRYARIVAALLGSRDEGLGVVVLAALFNIVQQRWFHGPAFDAEPQVRIIERMVAAELAREA